MVFKGVWCKTLDTQMQFLNNEARTKQASKVVEEVCHIITDFVWHVGRSYIPSCLELGSLWHYEMFVLTSCHKR